ncbi:fibronectin type III domain-containing protein [Kiritimatiellota bacterium B12222]|nr:fibronectin type III domain-containing protein [Kiritimatiellota bacterium B12222]
MKVEFRKVRLNRALCSMVSLASCLLPLQGYGNWSPDLVPETVVVDFRQEDLVDGPVTTWTSGGIKPKTATGTATKLANNGGVLFEAGTSQNLSWSTDRDAVWLHRWWVVISRADMDGVGGNVPVLTVNGAGNGYWHRQPVVKFSGSDGSFRSILNNHNGATVQLEDAESSFTDWNIMVGFRRGGQFHAWINGVEQAPIAFTGMNVCLDNSPSYLGANNISGENILAADVAIDCVLIGQSELNDAQVDKLVAWAHWRAGREDLLPSNHPYKNTAPSGLDANDNPSRFTFDQSTWDSWAAISTATKTVNIGNPPPSLDDGNGDDYSVVFFDDFKVDSVVDDRSGSPSDIWFAPTHIGSVVGASALAQYKWNTPSTYIHDDTDIGTMTLRLLDVNGNWKTGAFSSVNREGQGRSWGKGRFRIRCKFPAAEWPRPGFFPAFWSYGTEHLFWRTRNRIELDFFEYDGLNGEWLNTSQHIHAGSLAYNIPEIRQSPDIRDKIIGTPLNSGKNFVPSINIYDGQYHIWEFRIEDDYSYIIVDDKEVARVPTEAWMLVKRYIMVDWALREWENAAVDGEIYDMTIDWIEVQQRERDLDDVPSAFNTLPILTGTRGIGNTITCTPNVSASQLEYRWYKNGEPIVGETGPTFVEDADSVTKNLRCHVRAVSLLDQPEAWSATLTLPDTEAPTPPQNLTATAVSTSQINLSWDASTDNVGVQGYDILRDTQWIDVAFTPSYSDTGLSANTTYTYTVAAFDAEDNTSANSATASATTQSLGIYRTWDGAGTDNNWSNSANWSGGTPSGGNITFGADNRAAVGVVTNTVDVDTTISSLAYTHSTADPFVNNEHAHTTEIPAGVTLTLDGSSSPDNVLLVGGNEISGQYNSYVTMTGGGDLVINAPTSDFLAANASLNHLGNVYLDMSGLNSLTATVDNFYVGFGRRAGVEMTLPSFANGTNSITASVLVVGDSDGNSAADGRVDLNLGRYNEINADEIYVGARSNPSAQYASRDGYIQFQEFTSGATPTLKIRAKDGVSRANLTMAVNGAYSNKMNTRHIEAALDFTAGSVDALLGDVQVAQHQGFMQYGNPAGAEGTLSMSAGIIDASSITLGRSINRSANSATASGILNVSGGVFTTGTMILADNHASSGNVQGSLNVSGTGSVEVSGDLTLGNHQGSAASISATVTLTQGTLTVLGNMAPASDSLTITSNVILDGGNLIVSNPAENASLIIEQGTLQLSTGSATIDVLDLSSDFAVTTFEAAGTNVGDFAEVHVNQSLELGGSLVFSAVGNYIPAAGDSWTVITGNGTRNGEFENTVLPAGMTITYTANGFILAMPPLVGMGEAIWTGLGSDMKLTTAGNWDTLSSPANMDLIFDSDDRTVTGQVNALVDANLTISSLAYTNSTSQSYANNAYAHTTQISDGVTLTIDGSSAPDQAFLVGGHELSGQYHTTVTMTGGGNLVIDTPGLDFKAANPSLNHLGMVYLDLSGLNSVTASVDNFYVGFGRRAGAQLDLPSAEGGSTTLTTNLLVVGDSNGDSAADGQVDLNLGRHNVINADEIFVAARVDPNANYAARDGYIRFPTFSTGTSPTVKIRAKDGSSRAELTMAVNGAYSNKMNTRHVEAHIDFSEGSVDALLGDVLIAQQQAYIQYGNPAGAEGTLSMAAGTIDVNSLTLGRSIYRSSSPALASGTLNVSGGVFKAGHISLAENVASGGNVQGAIYVSGTGAVEVTGDLIMGTQSGSAPSVTASLTLSNGSMTVAGNIAPASDSLNITSDVIIDGGDLWVSNPNHDATLTIEHGTLSLTKGSLSCDILDLSSDFAITSFEAAGTAAGDYTQIVVTQNLQLGGTLVFTALGGFSPSSGDSWTVISGNGTRNGEFDSTQLPAGMVITYTSNGFTLSMP